MSNSQNKDYTQAIKESYDPSLERLRVDALINDGTDALVINPDGSVNTNIRDENGDAFSTLNPLPTSNTLEDPNNVLFTEDVSGIVDDNSTTTPLLAGQSYIGAWHESSQYASIAITVLTDVVSADLGFRVQYSHNASTIIRQAAVTFQGSPNGSFFSVATHAKYFRVVYNNGPINQTTLVIHTKLHVTAVGLAAVPIFVPFSDNTTVQGTRSVIVGQNPSGNYDNVSSTDNKALNVQLDSVLPISSSSLFTEGIRDDIFINFSDDASLAFIEDDGSVNGTYALDPVEGQLVIQTTAAAGSTAIVRSTKSAVYEPGHEIVGEQTIEISSMPTGDASVFWGYSDGNDSLGYILEAAGLYTIRIKNGTVMNKVLQSSWNRDRCQGATYTRFRFNQLPQALNPLNNNIYRYGFEWLGASSVKFFVKSPNDAFVPTHVFELPNQSTGTSVSTPHLPLSIEVRNNTTLGGNIAVRSGSWRGGIHTNKFSTVGRDPNEDYTDTRSQGQHNANSTSIPLDADEIYRGTWFKWNIHYTTIVSTVQSDVSGTLWLQASQEVDPVNGTDDDVSFELELAYDPAEFAVLRRNTPLQSVWVRHKYVNGNAAQSFFNLSAIFTLNDPGDTYAESSFLPSRNTFVGLSRSIGTITNADNTGYQDVPVDTATGNPKVTVQHVRDDILIRPLSVPLASQVVVGTSPVRLDPSPVADRRSTMLSNDGPGAISVGFSDSITFDSASMRMVVGAVRILPFNEDIEYWAIAEDTGGSESILTRSGTTGTGTATNPSNALLSDDTYSIIDANAETIEVDGYTAGTTNTLVSVKLGMEAYKQAGQVETVAHIATETGSAGNVGTVSTTNSVTAVDNQMYIAAISRENASANVTSVTGLGLGWTQLATVANAAARRIDVWYAIGTVGANSVVTATFSAVATNSHIAVSRYSNVSPLLPIEDFEATFGTGTAVTTLGITGTAKGMSYLAVAKNNETFTPGAGYTELSDETTPAGANRDGLATEIKALTVTGSEVPTGTTSSSIGWAAISLTLRPKAAINPEITLSYELSAVPGATSEIIPITSILDTDYILDITSDEAWIYTDIPNITVIATGSTIGAAAANIDYLFLEITDTTGNTSRVSIVQGGGPLV